MDGVLRAPFLAMLRSVWEDQVLRVAEALASGRSLESLAEWQLKVWPHIPSALQDECVAFVNARKSERHNLERRLGQAIISCARRLFTPRNEMTLVRPLSMLLWFQSAPDSVDLLHAPPS